MVGPRRKPYALRVFHPTRHDINPAMPSGGSGREWFEDARNRRSTDLPDGDRMENIGAGNCGDPLTCREHRIGEPSRHDAARPVLARQWGLPLARGRFVQIQAHKMPSISECLHVIRSERPQIVQTRPFCRIHPKIVGGGRCTTVAPTVFATFAVVCFSRTGQHFFDGRGER
jgi:hypothetical protein